MRSSLPSSRDHLEQVLRRVAHDHQTQKTHSPKDVGHEKGKPQTGDHAAPLCSTTAVTSSSRYASKTRRRAFSSGNGFDMQITRTMSIRPGAVALRLHAMNSASLTRPA